MPLGKLWIHPLFHVLCLLDIYLVTDMSWGLMEKKVISNQLRKLSHNYPGRSCKWHLNRKGINYLILLFLFFFLEWAGMNRSMEFFLVLPNLNQVFNVSVCAHCVAVLGVESGISMSSLNSKNCICFFPYTLGKLWCYLFSPSS